MAKEDQGMRDDDAAMEGHKSRWQEANSPAADDPVSADELNGLNLLGGSSLRGGALPGVSDPVRDGSGSPRDRADEGIRLGGAGGRKSPELVTDAGMGDGGIDMSGGVAGGARGHGGTSSAGAGGPMGDTAGGPAEHDAGSRLDLGHGTVDEPGDRRGG